MQILVYLIESILLKQIIALYIQYKTRKFFSIQLQNIQANAKDKILSQVSHDQRNQLGAIKMYTEEIIEIMEYKKKDISLVMSNCKQILRVIQFQQYLLSDFLDYNKMQNNLFQIRKKTFDIINSVKDLLELNQYNSEESNTKITVLNNLKDSLIYNDENRLQQVLINFISNSLKFTRNGEVYIILRDLDSYTLEIEIIDNGSGILKKK